MVIWNLIIVNNNHLVFKKEKPCERICPISLKRLSVTWGERKPKNPILNGMDSMAPGMLSLRWHH